MYRVAICEDEDAQRTQLAELLRAQLQELVPEHTVQAFASSQALAEALALGEKFDLLILDILMPELTGMELARQVRAYDEQVSIIFLTGSEQYLKEGYAVRPLQYLFKPVDVCELREALATDLRLHHQPRALTLCAGGRTVAIPVAEILYLESRNHALIVRMASGEQTFRMSLTEAERLLPQEQFCRCHNSFLVNLAQIVEIDRRELTLKGGLRVPVSKGCRDQLRRRFVDFLLCRAKPSD